MKINIYKLHIICKIFYVFTFYNIHTFTVQCENISTERETGS